MITWVAYFFAALVEFVRNSSNSISEETEQNEAEELGREAAENEMRRKVSLFSGYKTFVSEKLEEFTGNLMNMESKLPDDTELVDGAIGLLEKSMDSLKQKLNDSEGVVVRGRLDIADMELRVSALRNKTSFILEKATNLKGEVQDINSDFSHLNDKWNQIKNGLSRQASQIDVSSTTVCATDENFTTNNDIMIVVSPDTKNS